MNKFLSSTFSIILILSLAFTTAYAQTTDDTETTPNPTNESVTESLTEQITDLKEKIASRVAELNLVEKRGIIGEVTSVDGTEISIEDIYGNTRSIDVDEITNFDSDDADATFGISDIEEGMQISVLGLYNKQSERVLARFITVVSIPEYIQGVATNIDEDEFIITVQTNDDETYSVEVETSTDTQMFVDDDFEDSGFSEIENNQLIFVTGTAEDTNQITASNILLFPTDSADTTETDE